MGGGTSTKVVVGSEKEVLGKASAGPANPNFLSLEQATTNVAEGILKGLENTRLKPSIKGVNCIYAGISGLNQDEFREGLHQKIQGLCDDKLILVPDSQLAWHAAFNGKPGMIMIAGTGYIVYGSTGKKTAKTSVDNASPNLGGRSIAYHTIKKAKEEYNVERKADVENILKAAFAEIPQLKGVSYEESLNLILESAYTKNKVVPDKDIAGLTPRILECRDQMVNDVLSHAASQVAIHIQDISLELSLTGPIALFGSVSSNSRVVTHLKEALHHYQVIKPSMPPLYAALQLARGGL